MDFKLVSDYKPTGDQPKAIDSLVRGIEMGLDDQVNAPASGKVQQGVQLLLRAVNQGVLDATSGLLDTKTLAAGALTIAALRSKAQKGWAAPGAMTLLWWAARLFGAQSHE